MRIVIHPALLTLAFAAVVALPAGLQAQGSGDGTATNLACQMLTDAEIDAATGLDYEAGDPVEEGHPPGRSACLWGGASFAPGATRPQLGVMVTQMLPQAVNAPFPAAGPAAGCTRETLRGIGDAGFIDICERSRGPIAHVKVGRNRLMLQLDPRDGEPLASAKPALIALTKAAAARAKDR